MQNNIESRVADTILERTRKIEVGGHTFNVAPPTTATLILVSEQIAELPAVVTNAENTLTETLLIAKDCEPIGKIAATMILGERNLQQKKTITKTYLWGLIRREREVTINRQAELAAELLQTLGPRDLNQLIIQLLVGMEIADFFGLSTSLIEINLTRATRGVDRTIVSGR
jgi:hypothetical protein